MELRMGVNAYHMIQKQRLCRIKTTYPLSLFKRLEKKRTAFSKAERSGFFSLLSPFLSSVWGGNGGGFLSPSVFFRASPTQ